MIHDFIGGLGFSPIPPFPRSPPLAVSICFVWLSWVGLGYVRFRFQSGNKMVPL